MDRRTKRRIAVMLFSVAAVLGIFSLRLFKLQASGGDDSPLTSGRTLSYTTTVQAARGEILDCNGKALVSNRPCYDLTIANLAFFSGSGPAKQIRQLLDKCDSLGVTVTDTLPISLTAPYTYDENASYTQKQHLSAYLRWRDWDPEMSAKNLLARMRKLYRLPDDWDDTTARRVLGVRYELDLRYCVGLDNYVLAHDVTPDTLAAVLELGIPGVTAETGTVRVYNTEYAAHILGRIGPIYAEEVEEYKALGYSLDTLVGKEGLEKAFESWLHGENGKKTTVIDENGRVLETYYTKEPKAGNNVSLTVDIQLQAVAEDTLARVIEDLQANGVGAQKEGKDAKAGAVVAVNVKTGDILVSASYPTYDLSTFSEDFNDLLAAETSPLVNRALNATYSPGSIYKLVTAIAAIDGDGASRWRQITDRGVYTYYADQGYTCNCHIWTSSRTTHGTINMMEAVSHSCNYYFYEVGREAGISAIEAVAAGLGLGEKTGVELYEEQGVRANPETKAKLYAGTDSAGWYGADTLQASIGQSDNRFTPLQMAAYCATLASGGTRMQSTFLQRVSSWDSSQLLYEHTPQVVSTYEISSEAMAAVREGMELAASTGTAATYFRDYPITVAGKTGTAQHGGGGSDNASFICYAPADDPQIAIAVYVENGAQGGNLGQVARAILDGWFAVEPAMPQIPNEGSLS